MRQENISDIIRLASNFSVLLPFVIYLIRIKHVSRAVHIIGGLIILSALSDLTGAILYSQRHSTVLLFNVSYVLLFLLLSWFYYEILSRYGRKTIIGGLITYGFAFILVSVFVQSFFEYQTIIWTLGGMLLIFYSISYFLHLFSAQTLMSNHGLLWINSGILFYFSFNLFLFIMSSYVLTKAESEISMLIWSFHNVNNIMKNIILAFGISVYSKEPAVDALLTKDSN